VLDAPIATEGPLQRSADGVFLFIRIETQQSDPIREAAESLTTITDYQHIRNEADHEVVRLEVTRPFIALSLVDHGVTIQDIRVEDGTARIVMRIPDGISLQTVDQVFRNAFTDPQMVSKRQIDREAGIETGSILDDLTDRQLEVVQAAFYAGYFESPRGSTGEEVAGALGISAPGFYNHIRAVERKLFTRLIEDSEIDVQP
jgi:predicted DNA binding protein